MKSSFLPVGSVVLLKGAEQRVVIIGFAVKEDNNDKVWDYLGAPYPIGVIGSDKNLLFEREQIQKVVASGYSDDEEKKFREMLEDSMKEIKK